MAEYDFDGDIRQGDSGLRVRHVQEWLSLHGIHLLLDGKFGPATNRAVQNFQETRGLSQSGVVDRTTFDRLVQPILESLKPVPASNHTLGSCLVDYARQHLGQSPREIGGENRGPWVRLYMDGNEGPGWPWCAGFASFVLKQAAVTLNRALPIRTSFSCDLLASSAMTNGCFLEEKKAMSADIPPGSLFLSRRTTGDWNHTGIVIQANHDSFETIEGNTNDAGSPEGYEVCRRVRGYVGKDFVVIR